MKKREGRREEKAAEVFERLYPLVFSLIAAVGCWVLDIEFKDSLSDLLSICVSFSSILLGFIGVLIALLFSLNQNALREYILENPYYRERMHRFLQLHYVRGFFLFLLSLLFYVKNTLSCFALFRILYDAVKIAWLFVLVYFVASSYRLIRVVLKIAFYKKAEDEEKKEEEYDAKAYRKMQEAYEVKGKAKKDS